MESPYIIISGFVTTLEEAAEEHGVEGLCWKMSGRRLELTVEPEGLLPSCLTVERVREEAAWLASNEVLGVVHVVDRAEADTELPPRTRDLVERLALLILENGDTTLADALDVWEDRAVPVGGLDRVGLAESGFQRAVSVQHGEGSHIRMAYHGADPADSERLRALDERLAADRGLSPEEMDEYGELRNIPRCCIEAFDAGLLFGQEHREHVAWLDAFLAAAGPDSGVATMRHPALLNFLAARLYQLPFFSHLPCGPGCTATEEMNQRALDTLYEPADAAVIREIMTTSFICWPDGRMVPFRCEGIEDDIVLVSHPGELRRPDHMAPEYRSLLRTSLPRADESAAVDSLRRVGSRWEARTQGRWRRLLERSRWFRSIQPRIILF